ncbi:ERF family protein [Lysinibacillus fusiformis]|uniref:ERF family protein n=1 Tax=Lysinibacillus fusiformis TaxID=28031 RepID=UPI003D00F0AC
MNTENEEMVSTQNENTVAKAVNEEEVVVVGKGLLGKLLEVRKRVPYLQKKSLGHQYNYVGSSDVLGALRAELDNQGLMLFPHVIDKELHMTTAEITQKNNTKLRTTIFTELKMEFEWVDVESGESKSVPFYAQGLDYDGEKGIGKALTYAEKYFLLKQFNIPTDQLDPDAFQQQSGLLTPNFITNEQVNELSGIVLDIVQTRYRLGEQVTGDTIVQNLGVSTLEKIEVKNFQSTKGILKSWLNETQAQLGMMKMNMNPLTQQPMMNQQQQMPMPLYEGQQEHNPYYQMSDEGQMSYPSYPENTAFQESVNTVPTSLKQFTGELVFVTPPAQHNGQLQCALNLIANDGTNLSVIVFGEHAVKQFESITTGTILSIAYSNGEGIPVFEQFV